MRLIAIWVFIVISFTSIAQGVNGYAEVSSISGTNLTLTNVDESDDTFENGEFVLIIQMQDSVIGDTSNSSSFGSIGSIISAGLYEIATISSHVESGGILTSIVVSGSLTNTYRIGANSKVQVLTYPEFGSPDYTTTGNMNPPNWDGNTGGILAFRVGGTLTLSHNITADEAGFRGGVRDGSGGGNCDTIVFKSGTSNRYANKGEGIYLNTNPEWNEARGKIVNGGGGGNLHNAGGGGGGNYTAGGNGGRGYNAGCSGNSAHGFGGVSLQANISGTRIFMGGGGGGGEGNNNVSTDGGNGGGMIFIKADSIVTSGGCGGLAISANGENTSNGGNDGVGGAGAGGSIVLDIFGWNIQASCPLTIESNGGDGGRSNTGSVHGGGGGGGQGAVIFNGSQPGSNTTVQTLNGIGGCDNNSNPCNSSAENGQGSDNGGIIENTGTPLPIELLDFYAQRTNNQEVELTWVTASEINNDYFEIYRSSDGKDWELILTENGAGNSRHRIDYLLIDFNCPKEKMYYKLRQIDFDGSFTESKTAIVPAVNYENKNDLIIGAIPNPVNRGSLLKVKFSNFQKGETILILRDISGREHLIKVVSIVDSSTLEVLNISNSLSSGIYTITASSNDKMVSSKLLVK